MAISGVDTCGVFASSTAWLCFRALGLRGRVVLTLAPVGSLRIFYDDWPFLEDGASLWVEISPATKHPIAPRCAPIEREMPMRGAHFSWPDPTTVDIPRVCKMSPHNVFVSGSTFLLNRWVQRGRGYPVRCSPPKKEDIVTGCEGWICERDGAFRPFLIQKAPHRCNAKGRRGNLPEPGKDDPQKAAGGIAHSDTSSDCSESRRRRLAASERRGGFATRWLSLFWFPDDEPEHHPEEAGDRTALDPTPILASPRIMRNQ